MDLDVHVLTVEAGHFISVHATKEEAMHAAGTSGVWYQKDNGFWRCPPYRVTKHKLRVDDMKVRKLDSALDEYVRSTLAQLRTQRDDWKRTAEINQRDLAMTEMSLRETQHALAEANEASKRWANEAASFEQLWGLVNAERGKLKRIVEMQQELAREKADLRQCESNIEVLLRRMNNLKDELAGMEMTRAAVENKLLPQEPEHVETTDAMTPSTRANTMLTDIARD